MSSEVEIFQKLFEPLTYHAPGSESSTQRALDATAGLADQPQILDIGCGVGRQTLDLMRLTPGRVTAIDLNATAVETLARLVGNEGLSHRVAAVRGSMSELCFADESFDLIWSEGAIYCMGFADGLSAWKRYLRPGGFLAVTELTWLSESPPRATRMYWQKQYPGMVNLSDNLAAIDRAGYQQIGDFALPESDWWDRFYRDLSAEIVEFKRRHPGSEGVEYEGQALIEQLEAEIHTLRESQGSYSYVFYIMRKPA